MIKHKEYSNEKPKKIVKNLCAKDSEQEWLEFKKKLSEIFIQIHISEKSGRGVPKIVEVYGRNAFTFEENDIVVTIPFNKVKQVGNKVGDRIGNIQSGLNQTRQTILSEMRNNPNITKAELSRILGISTTAIDNNISFLKKNEYIERKGSNKTGYWMVNEKKI